MPKVAVRKSPLTEGSPYTMCVRNVASHIRSSSEEGRGFDVFTAAQVLSAAFCKIQEDVLADIISVEV